MNGVKKMKYRIDTELLSDLIKDRKINGKRLADVCSVTPSYIYQIKSGKCNCSISILKKIADALGVDVKNLIIVEPEPDREYETKRQKEILTEDEAIKRFGWDAYVNASILNKYAEHDVYANRATFFVYDLYVELCVKNNAKPLYNKMQFSKFVTSHFGYYIEDIKRKGKKYRVFRKKGSSCGSRLVQNSGSR